MSDPLLPGLSGPTESGTVNGSLDVGETWVYTGSYTVTQADIDSNGTVEVGDLGAGFIDNTVTSTTTEVPTPQTSVVNTPLSQAGSYTVAKAATGIDTAGNGVVDAAGDVIDFTVTVVNTGNQTLTGVSVSDPLLPGLSGPVESGTVNGSLDVGETWTYTGSWAVTQADIDSNGTVEVGDLGPGAIDNTVTATTTEVPTPQTSVVNTPLTQTPAYTVAKAATGVDIAGNGVVDAAGDVIDYTMTLVNTGNQTLTGVSVTDPLLGALTGPVESGTVNGSLDVGETWTYTGSWAVTQADIDSNGTVEVGDLGPGAIDNTVTATTTEVPTPQTSVVNTPLTQAGSYTVAKAATGIDTTGDGVIDAAGDVIDYTITLVNTGNQTLTGVSVTDPLLGALTGPVESGTINGSLDVGETWTYTGSYTVTQADIDSDGTAEVGDLGPGFIDNTVTSTTTEDPTPQTSTEKTPVGQLATYTIVKTVIDIDGDGTGAGPVDVAGDVITYQVEVTSMGNQSITNVVVSDPLLPGLLGPTESGTVNGFSMWAKPGPTPAHTRLPRPISTPMAAEMAISITRRASPRLRCQRRSRTVWRHHWSRPHRWVTRCSSTRTVTVSRTWRPSSRWSDSRFVLGKSRRHEGRSGRHDDNCC